LCIYFRQPDGDFKKVSGGSPSELETLPDSLPVLADLAHHRSPLDYPSPGQPASPLLAPLQPECLTPKLGRHNQLVGFIILGQRLSEEPYSAEDKRLLGAAASQAATALDNVWLARQIADRLEAERRAAREMEIARDVQARLLPQTAPRLPSLSCAAQCIQARSVGGDYFDFLQFDSRHLGLVLADVSGKGVHAALLVANLQAYLRSQMASGVLDPAQSLRLVNRMLFATTAAEHYATLFYGIHDDSTRCLTYVNCGLNPPILLRHDGTIERLPATALVIGLFEGWECSVAEIQFGPGDMLAVFSDGVTEASQNTDEFGEDRLITLLKANRPRPENEIVRLSLAEIQTFCSGILAGDMTMLIARTNA
jgi:serine phosphatase RsbU (regulator of sigma subunit)